MKLRSILPVILLLAAGTMAQTDKSESVKSIDSIIDGVYKVISGGAGEKRDWDHFRSLFHPDARLIPVNTDKDTKAVSAKAMTPDQYIERASPFFEKNGFFETEIARKTERFGNIAHVFSSYNSFYKSDDKQPFARGINSFQLMFDGKRWWIVTIYWQGESKDLPIPAQYLK